MTRRVNRGESQTGPSPALGNPHQTPVPTFPQRWRRRAAWQRQSPTPLKSGPLTDSCTEPDIELDKNSFEDVIAVLGKSSIYQYEDANAICYRSSSADPTVVQFEAGSAGAWKYLTVFTVSVGPIKGVPPRTCSRSRRVSRDVATASGLRLGLTEKEIEDILGKPTERHSSSLVYTSLGHRKMTDEEQQTFPQSGAFDIMTLIKLKLVDGHVTWFQVAYTVTA